MALVSLWETLQNTVRSIDGSGSFIWHLCCWNLVDLDNDLVFKRGCVLVICFASVDYSCQRLCLCVPVFLRVPVSLCSCVSLYLCVYPSPCRICLCYPEILSNFYLLKILWQFQPKYFSHSSAEWRSWHARSVYGAINSVISESWTHLDHDKTSYLRSGGGEFNGALALSRFE